MRLFCLLLVASIARAADFTGSAGLQGWTAAHDIAAPKPSAEGLVLTVTGGDPFLVGPRIESRDGIQQLFTARFQSPAEGWGQVFFYKDNCREENSRHFAVRVGWNEIAVPLPPLDKGWRLRLDFPATSGDTILASAGLRPIGFNGVLQVEAAADTIKIAHRGAAKIVALHPWQNLSDAATAPVVAVCDTFSGNVTISRWDGTRDRLYSGFVALDGKGCVIDCARYVENAAALARDTRPLPTTKNKKGLQIQEMDDTLAIGVQHAGLNVGWAQLIDLNNTPGNPQWKLDGKTYSFHRKYLDSLRIRQLTEQGIAVYLIFLAYESRPEINQVILHPKRDAKLPNHMAAFNTATEEGVQALRATIEFLTWYYSQPGDPNGRVSGIIFGNEVNAHKQWYNFGPLPLAVGVGEYTTALRIAHTAVRTASSTVRLYTSFDQHWQRQPGPSEYRSRTFIDHLALLSRMGGDFDWAVAYHPYPDNLFEPRFWNDQNAWPTPDSPKITFKNLKLLTTYLAQPLVAYQGGEPRKIILSEQGFHSDRTAQGDQYQAAAYCLAWDKITHIPEIDAFIYHRHVDHKQEGGLNLGLWTRKPDSISAPDKPAPIHEVFKAAGTPEQEKAFEFALPIIGIKTWAEGR